MTSHYIIQKRHMMLCQLVGLNVGNSKWNINDKYFNALQIKYAYAITCHKAQGGLWSHIYVDQGYMTDDMLTPDYIHWLYTALTRATEKLYLVIGRRISRDKFLFKQENKTRDFHYYDK